MKATLETVTGVTINRDIDTADSPMGIIRKFYEEDATAATQIFSNQKAIDQLMDGHIDEAKSAFELLSIEGDSIKADWKTALCNQPAIKEEMSHCESDCSSVRACSLTSHKNPEYHESLHKPALRCYRSLQLRLF